MQAEWDRHTVNTIGTSDGQPGKGRLPPTTWASELSGPWEEGGVMWTVTNLSAQPPPLPPPSTQLHMGQPLVNMSPPQP